MHSQATSAKMPGGSEGSAHPLRSGRLSCCGKLHVSSRPAAGGQATFRSLKAGPHIKVTSMYISTSLLKE
jgi:hypothetical protein